MFSAIRDNMSHIKPKRDDPTKQLTLYLNERKISFVREYPFHKHYCDENNLSEKPRQFKFDFAIIPLKIALEIEGGIYTLGRHIRPLGFLNDCIKYNLAATCGWTVYRLPTCFFEGKSKYYQNLIEVLNNLTT